MPRFIKKPVAIDAIQWTGENLEELRQLWGEKILRNEKCRTELLVQGSEIYFSPTTWDWIVEDEGGELSVYGPDEFKETYEAVEKRKEATQMKMHIIAIWPTDTENPKIIDAWDEQEIERNKKGFEAAVGKYTSPVRVGIVEVPDSFLGKMFEQHKVAGKVIE